jgi:hypothetical protein
MAGEPDDVDAMVEPVVSSRHRWLAGLRRLDQRGAFLFSLNDYAVICGRIPR